MYLTILRTNIFKKVLRIQALDITKAMIKIILVNLFEGWSLPGQKTFFLHSHFFEKGLNQ
jgi:hypothetical protein